MNRKISIKSILSVLTILLLFQSVVLAAVADTGYSDVDTDSWYTEAVKYCRDNGLMSGTSTTTFAPYDNLSCAMLVTILHRASGLPAINTTATFTDVAVGTWYSDAVSWASQNGIIAGYGNNMFGTNDSVTREQLITILWRYDGGKAAASTPAFSDMGNIASWAADAVAWGNENGIINIKDNNRFDPKGNAIRAEAAYMMYRLFGNSKNSDEEVVTTNNGEVKINIQVGSKTFTATLADNASARAFAEQLPLTVNMSDYGGFEKVGSLGVSLPTSNESITTEPGDLILYQGNQIVIFYAPNSWSYTRLGKINDVTQSELKNILGSGSVTVTLSLTP